MWENFRNVIHSRYLRVLKRIKEVTYSLLGGGRKPTAQGKKGSYSDQSERFECILARKNRRLR